MEGCHYNFQGKYTQWFPHEKFPLYTNKVWDIKDCRDKCHPVFQDENEAIAKGEMTESQRSILPKIGAYGTRGNKGKLMLKEFDSPYLSQVLDQQLQKIRHSPGSLSCNVVEL